MAITCGKKARRTGGSELESELAEARSLLETIANSTEHADAAQKWECEKAELVNCLADVLNEHDFYCACGGGKIAVDYDGELHNERCVIVKAETLIAKYEAK